MPSRDSNGAVSVGAVLHASFWPLQSSVHSVGGRLDDSLPVSNAAATEAHHARRSINAAAVIFAPRSRHRAVLTALSFHCLGPYCAMVNGLDSESETMARVVKILLHCRIRWSARTTTCPHVSSSDEYDAETTCS